MDKGTLTKSKSFNLYHLITHVSKIAFHTFSIRDVQYKVTLDGLKSITDCKTELATYDPGKSQGLDSEMKCVVLGDECKMRRVLANILSNVCLSHSKDSKQLIGHEGV